MMLHLRRKVQQVQRRANANANEVGRLEETWNSCRMLYSYNRESKSECVIMGFPCKKIY